MLLGKFLVYQKLDTMSLHTSVLIRKVSQYLKLPAMSFTLQLLSGCGVLLPH